MARSTCLVQEEVVKIIERVRFMVGERGRGEVFKCPIISKVAIVEYVKIILDAFESVWGVIVIFLKIT